MEGRRIGAPLEEGKRMETQTETPQEFFFTHAGFSYDPKRETKDVGRWRCSVALAEAEDVARRAGANFDWEDDWSLGVSHAEFYSDEAYPSNDGEPDSCESCTLVLDGEVLASLGCIDGADSDYRRVVEAELALEVIDQLRKVS